MLKLLYFCHVVKTLSKANFFSITILNENSTLVVMGLCHFKTANIRRKRGENIFLKSLCQYGKTGIATTKLECYPLKHFKSIY
jgi:hypothetical protein